MWSRKGSKNMARRGENIHKRKDGRWEARFLKGRINNKSIYISFYGKTYKEAKKKLTDYIKYNHTNKKTKTSFNEIFNSWINYKKYFIKDSTYNKYLNLYNNYIHVYFKSINIEQISNLDIQDFIIYLMNLNSHKTNKGLSTSTIKSTVYIIKSTMLFAQKDKYINNISFQVKIPNQEVKKIQFLTRSEQKDLEKFVKNKYSIISFAILLCLYTGLRIGELCALTINDIDLNKKFINVDKSVQRIQKKKNSNPMASKTSLIITIPKTKNAVRKIPISSVLNSILEKYLPLVAGKKYLFSNKDGNMIDPRTIQYQFKQVLEKAELPPISFHALRHTFATRCIELGMDMKTLSEILGHSNVTTTMSIYVHSTELQKKEQIELLANL